MMRETRLKLNQQYTEEAVLMKKVVEWLEPQKRDGIKVMRIVDRYTKGYSDLFICARGKFIVAELKDDTGVPSIHQELFIDDMRAAGAIGGICRTIKDVKDLIDEALYCSCKSGKLSYSAHCPECGKEVR